MMADFGSMIENGLITLKGSVDSYGRILEGREGTVSETIGTITKTLGINMDITTVTDPELGEYQAIQVEDHICTSPDDIYNEVYNVGGDMTVDNFYTGTSEVCAGVLSTDGGEYLAKAFTFAAPNANLQFKADPEDAHAYLVVGPDFRIRIEEAITGQRPAKVILYNENYPYDYDSIEPFNSDYAYGLSTPLCYIRYYLYKGSSGDCYFKGYYSNDTTPFDQDTPEVADEEFKDVSMNIFTGYVLESDVYVPQKDSKNYGGFSIIGVESKMTSGSDSGFDFSYSASASNYAVVLWKTNGTPLHVSLKSATIKWEKEGANEKWRRIITNSSNQIVAFAPLFTPGSHEYASINSFWSMVISKDGMYDLTVGDGGQYRYDHGFVIRI